MVLKSLLMWDIQVTMAHLGTIFHVCFIPHQIWAIFCGLGHPKASEWPMSGEGIWDSLATTPNYCLSTYQWAQFWKQDTLHYRLNSKYLSKEENDASIRVKTTYLLPVQIDPSSSALKSAKLHAFSMDLSWQRLFICFIMYINSKYSYFRAA